MKSKIQKNYCDIKKTPEFWNFLKPYINICRLFLNPIFKVRQNKPKSVIEN